MIKAIRGSVLTEAWDRYEKAARGKVDLDDLLVTPATKTNPRGQVLTAKLSACNKL
jgi:hypothetical protein